MFVCIWEMSKRLYILNLTAAGSGKWDATERGAFTFTLPCFELLSFYTFEYELTSQLKTIVVGLQVALTLCFASPKFSTMSIYYTYNQKIWNPFLHKGC